MRRADRLFDIIQMLRVAVQPITAAMIAERLEVTVRTVYRDIATLQARRIPIEGAPGLGYLLRRGFDLPPLMFTADEVDAIAVGARLVRRLRDPGLQSAAESVLAKVTRDRLMLGFHAQFPEYGFAEHKGYGTAKHLAAIATHGACAIHRISFAPLKGKGLNLFQEAPSTKLQHPEKSQAPITKQ